MGRYLWILLSVFAFAACSDGDGGGSLSAGGDLAIAANPEAIVFGAVPVGDKAERLVTLTHVGASGEVRLRSIQIVTDVEGLSVSDDGVRALAPGESAQLTVVYEPVDGQTARGMLRVETNIPDRQTGSLTVEIPIQGGGQGGALRVLPSPVAFGDVDAGEVSEQQPSLLNAGTEPVKVIGMEVKHPLGGEAFALVDGPELPATIQPETATRLTLSYAPVGHGTDTGSLEIAYELPDGEVEHLNVPLLGTGVGPRITAFPAPLDFGWRPVDITASMPLTLTNSGTRALVIESGAFVEGSSATLTWDGLDEAPLTLEPQESASVFVNFLPTSDMEQTTSAIGTLRFVTNDYARRDGFDVDIYGRGEVPILTVNPDHVSFGFVAQGQTRRRKVSLFNAGAAPLTISEVSFVSNDTGEFSIANANWGPSESPAAPFVLPAAEVFEINLDFINDGPDSGQQLGTLRIYSNDGNRPEWDVQLTADRAGSPTCEFALIPPQLNFGTVARGSSKTLKMDLVNTGSGACSFDSWLINDCSGFFGFLGATCPDPTTTTRRNGDSKHYEVTHHPLAIQNGLQPGDAYPIEVTFTPPDDAPLIGDELAQYAGALSLRIYDPHRDSRVLVPTAPGGSVPPNLHAKSGIAQLAVLPSEVDYSLTTVGCSSRTMEVIAYNVGSAPMELSDVQLQGCSAEFVMRSAPPLPMELAINDDAVFGVSYQPQDIGSDGCSLAFYTNGEDTPTVVVPLSGGGTYETEHTDTFIQTSSQAVDVLFVIDNSGSMSEEQSNLIRNFQAFINAANAWGSDYQIGVVTTDLEADNGRLISAGNNARFVTPSNSHEFVQNANVGTNGSADEKGLACAQAALSMPNTAGSGPVDRLTACSNDSECVAPDRCWDGYCGGRNRGFIRDDAALEVVIVSDEEDSSAGDVNFYVNFFKSIKGFYNENLFHFHAIIGDIPSGCSSPDGNADPGHRYAQVAAETGGIVASICSPDFASALESIGDVAFGLRTQFFLSRLADPATLQVRVNGQLCTSQAGSNWTYHEPSNSVVFDEAAPCMPETGDEIQIHYQTLCLSPQ